MNMNSVLPSPRVSLITDAPSNPFLTCDLCDAHKSAKPALRVLAQVYRSFGAKVFFSGVVKTVKCFEDNSRVKEAVESAGHGRVLVVDGAGSLNRALLGGNLAAAAAKNGWAGLLIYGAVRDAAELRQCEVGIFALTTVPMPTERQGQGLSNVPVQIQGTWIHPGDYLYADEDGIVMSERPLI